MVVIEAAPGPGSCAVSACDCGQELDCCQRLRDPPRRLTVASGPFTDCSLPVGA
jgi:hypothetical protein